MEAVASLFCKERMIFRNENLAGAAREAETSETGSHQMASLQTRLSTMWRKPVMVRRQSAAATALSAYVRSNDLGEILDCFR